MLFLYVVWSFSGNGCCCLKLNVYLIHEWDKGMLFVVQLFFIISLIVLVEQQVKSISFLDVFMCNLRSMSDGDMLLLCWTWLVLMMIQHLCFFLNECL